LLVSLLPGVAWADDIAKARKLFADGVRLYQAGDYEGALRVFKEANAEHHAPAIVYNVGLAEERAGHRQAALDAYESYIAEAGDKGEFTTAAVAAVAQIRKSSTKLRMESKPPGARLFLDGNPLAEPAPTAIVVGAGLHVIVAQGDGWRVEKQVTAAGTGDVLEVALEAPPPPPTVEAPPAEPSSPPAIDLVPPEAIDRKPEPVAAVPDGFVWGAAFAVAPAYMIGVPTFDSSDPKHQHPHPNDQSIATVLAGPLVEVGYALTEKVEFLARGLFGVGPDGKPSTMWMGGPGLSFHLGRAWAGATFIGGRIDSARHNQTYSTDLVFGMMSEVGVVVLEKPFGEWVVAAQPSFLLTELRNDNTTLFIPLSFGLRAY
jgi:hypothetical protein